MQVNRNTVARGSGGMPSKMRCLEIASEAIFEAKNKMNYIGGLQHTSGAFMVCRILIWYTSTRSASASRF